MNPGLKDRSAALVFAGVVEILIGALLLLLVPLALFGDSIAQAQGSSRGAGDRRSIVVSAVVYLALAIFFVWTGVDTVRRRRWARTLMHSVAWLWLIVGIAGFIGWLVLMPLVDSLVVSDAEPSLAPGILIVVKLVVSIVLLVVYVAMPAAFVVFLRSPSVRATVARHDPTVPWTDRVTPRVLSMILTLVYLGATVLLLVPFGGAPCFGTLLGPVPSAWVWLVVAAACGRLAYGFYRGDPRACWGTIALTLVATISTVWTFLRVDAMESWAALGLQEAQLDLLRDSWIASSGAMIGMSVLSGATVIGYALYVRRDMAPGKSTIDETPLPRHDPPR